MRTAIQVEPSKEPRAVDQLLKELVGFWGRNDPKGHILCELCLQRIPGLDARYILSHISRKHLRLAIAECANCCAEFFDAITLDRHSEKCANAAFKDKVYEAEDKFVQPTFWSGAPMFSCDEKAIMPPFFFSKLPLPEACADGQRLERYREPDWWGGGEDTSSAIHSQIVFKNHIPPKNREILFTWKSVVGGINDSFAPIKLQKLWQPSCLQKLRENTIPFVNLERLNLSPEKPENKVPFQPASCLCGDTCEVCTEDSATSLSSDSSFKSVSIPCPDSPNSEMDLSSSLGAGGLGPISDSGEQSDDALNSPDVSCGTLNNLRSEQEDPSANVGDSSNLEKQRGSARVKFASLNKKTKVTCLECAATCPRDKAPDHIFKKHHPELARHGCRLCEPDKRYKSYFPCDMQRHIRAKHKKSGSQSTIKFPSTAKTMSAYMKQYFGNE